MKHLPNAVLLVRERSDAAHDCLDVAWDALQRVPEGDIESQMRATDTWAEARGAAHAAQDEFEKLLTQVA